MKTELTNRAAVVWAVAFEGSGKSREWQAGMAEGSARVAEGEVLA